MKRTIAGILTAFLMTGCTDASGTAGNSVTEITAEEAYKMMQSEDDITIVDVRTESEYAEYHIQNAILIPNETIEKDPPEQLKDKDAVILVYCRSGRRSAQAAKKLAAMGYTHIYDFGGISSWPYETVSGK